MDASRKEFSDLCKAVAGGDSEAVARFRRMVVPYLRIIIRRAVRTGRRLSGFHGKAESGWSSPAARLGASPGSAPGRGSRTQQVARQMCEALIEAVQSTRGRLPHETILGYFAPQTLSMQGSSSQPVG